MGWTYPGRTYCSQPSSLYSPLLIAFLRQNRRLSLRSLDTCSKSFILLTKETGNLRLVIFSSCTWLTDELLRPVLQSNKLIERLDISDCTNLTTSSLQTVAVSLGNLTHLVLEGCSWVTGLSIDYLAFHHSKRIEAAATAVTVQNNPANRNHSHS